MGIIFCKNCSRIIGCFCSEPADRRGINWVFSAGISAECISEVFRKKTDRWVRATDCWSKNVCRCLMGISDRNYGTWL